MKSKGEEYVLVTPLKNEINNIDTLVNSVVNQSLKPILWVIVDDNSSDGSQEKLKKYSQKYDFIKVIEFPKKEKYNLGMHYSEVYKFGFDWALRYCEENNLKYEYIGVLDADMIIPNNFFKKLIEEMEIDPTIGIIGADILSFDGKKYVDEKTKKGYPRGGNRILRKNCFFDINGYEITYSSDVVSNIKAVLRGWKIKKVENILAKQTRLTGSTEGFKKRYMIKGEAHYYLYHRLVIIFLRFIKYLFQKRFYLAFYYLYGYIRAYLTHMERINDPEIKEYFQNKNILSYLRERRL